MGQRLAADLPFNLYSVISQNSLVWKGWVSTSVSHTFQPGVVGHGERENRRDGVDLLGRSLHYLRGTPPST